jgi:hypothetical protein
MLNMISIILIMLTESRKTLFHRWDILTIQFDPMALTPSLLTVAEATRAVPDATAVVAQVGGMLQVSVAAGLLTAITRPRPWRKALSRSARKPR